MTKGIVKRTHFVLSNHKYFMGRAENVKLGTYGVKRISPVFTNYLDGQGHIGTMNFCIDKPATVTIDFEKSKKADFDAAAGYKVANAGAGFSFESMKQGKLVLLKMLLTSEDIRKYVNNDKELLEVINSYRKPCIVNQIFVVVEAAFAEEFSSHANFNASFKKDALTIDATAEAGSSGKTTLTISNGTVFAYGIVKPVFNKENNKVIRMDTDQWGIG